MRDYVLVIGSGMMGSGIGAMSALAGNKTILLDVNEEYAQAGKERALACIHLRIESGLNTMEEGEHAKRLLETGTNIREATEKAKLVIEAIVENLEIKQNLFMQLDELLPAEVPICSNTSGLRISEISLKCKYPERAVTTHFWLPAHLVPLVEVVMGERTDKSIAINICNELASWGKKAVLVKKDLPGQLANRIFQAIIRESIAIVASGLASASDVDAAISCGMAMRFPAWGPLKHLDAIGLELGLSVQEAVLPDISGDSCVNDYIRTLVEEGNLGVKTGNGFYDWSKEDIEKDIEKRDLFIIEAVKITNRLDKKYQ